MLVWSGLVSLQALTKARPYMLLVAFVVGCCSRPTFSRRRCAVPMYLLYESGLLLARFMLPEKTRVIEKQAGT